MSCNVSHSSIGNNIGPTRRKEQEDRKDHVRSDLKPQVKNSGSGLITKSCSISCDHMVVVRSSSIMGIY